MRSVALRFVPGLLALACGAVCGLLSSLKMFEMVDQVNEKLPREKQFNPLRWYPPKYQRLWRHTRGCTRTGSLPLHTFVLMAVSFACLLITVWSLGFFGR